MTYFKHSSWKLSTPLPAAAAPTRPAPSACTAPCCPRLLFHGCWSSFSLLNCLSGQRFQLGGLRGVAAVGSGGPFGAVPVAELPVPAAVWLLDVGSARLGRPRPLQGLSKGKM